MKKVKTEVKKLRIDAETLLPLESRQVKVVAAGHTLWLFDSNSNPYHI